MSQRKSKHSHSSSQSEQAVTVALSNLVLHDLQAQLGLPVVIPPQVFNYNSGGDVNFGAIGGVNYYLLGYCDATYGNDSGDPTPRTSITLTDGDVVSFTTLATRDLLLTKLTAGAYVDGKAPGVANSSLQASIFVTTVPVTSTMNQVGSVATLSPSTSSPQPVYLSGETALNVTIPAGSYFGVVFQYVGGGDEDSVSAGLNAVVEYQ